MAGIVVTRDGVDVSPVLADENAAFTWLLRYQGQSFEYAMTYGGYAFREATDGDSFTARVSAREVELRDAAREDVAQRGSLARVLRGIGTEGADPGDVATVSRIVGYDVRARATGTYGHVNVALLRSSLRRWATVEAHDLSGGAA